MPEVKVKTSTGWVSLSPAIIPIVSTLPTNPGDGTEVYYQNTAMAAKEVVWHLRYRAGAGTNKWEYLGGAPLYAQQSSASNQTTANVSTYAQMTNTPTLVVPLSGDYIVRANGAIQNTAVSIDARVAIAENGVNKSSAAWMLASAQWDGGTYGCENTTALTAGLTLDLRVATDNRQASYGNPSLWMLWLRPIAVR